MHDRHRQDAGREHRRIRHPPQVRHARRATLADVRAGGERTSQAWTVPSVAAEARSQAAGLAVLEAEGEDGGDDDPRGNGHDPGTATDRRRIRPFDVIRTVDNAYSATGGLTMLTGNLAPKGAVVKTAGVSPKMLKHTGPGGDLRQRDRRL